MDRNALLKVLDVGCSQMSYAAGLMKALGEMTDVGVKLEGIDILDGAQKDFDHWISKFRWNYFHFC